MIKAIWRNVRQVTVPEGLVILAVVALTGWTPVLDRFPAIERLYAPVAFAAAALLALRFHQGRIFLAVGMVAFAAFGLRATLPAAGAALPIDAGPVTRLASVIGPPVVGGLAFVPERGVASVAGATRIAGLAAGLALVAYVAVAAPAWVVVLAESPLLASPGGRFSSVSQAGNLAFGATAVALVVRQAVSADAVSRGLFWALAAAYLALHSAPALQSVYFGTAGLVLAVAVVESAYSMAYRDGLTGLPGRRAFDEALLRLGRRYTVAMIDVDRFKAFNDTHGHAVGDQVLRMVARHLRDARGGGRAYRYGGEEFSILFPGRPLASCLGPLEALRGSIESASFNVRSASRPKKKPKPTGGAAARSGGQRVSVTVSIGVAESDDGAAPPGDTVRAADEALYRAKRAGRNRMET